jgi:hypothetical protein
MGTKPLVLTNHSKKTGVATVSSQEARCFHLLEIIINRINQDNYTRK